MAKKRGVLSGIARGEGRLTGPTGTYSIFTEGQTPCSAACPAGVDIKTYVNLIADRRYEDAVAVVRRANPFPGICGRVCTHPCEAECGRKDIDQPVSIKALKRFAADYELSRKRQSQAPEPLHKQRIAVVGSGPAGLTAAADLALSGFHVTVFEASREAGGLMSWGIPDFRLPKNIVRSEVRDIEALGVRMVTGKAIEDPAGLLNGEFSAVILATGCQAPILAGIPGEGGNGVIDCLDFLRGVSERRITGVGGKVLVIGGGNAALDSARTALRLGAKVTIAYRRTEDQMPADREEIAHARDEGISFEFLAIPAEVFPGRAVKFQRARLGAPDASGRRRPEPIQGQFFELEAETVIMAIGSKADATGLPKGLGLTKAGTVEADENGMTSIRGMFAAGDLASGPSTIVDAIGSGHDVAAGVMKFLLGDVTAAAGQPEMLVVERLSSEKSERCGTCLIPMEGRTSTFDEAELGMAERAAITEAQRCMRCGTCNICDVCLAVCDYRNAVLQTADEVGVGEIALAKIPFEVALSALEALYKPGDQWEVETGKAKAEVSIQPFLARVFTESCIACGKCEESCPYKAIRTVFGNDGKAQAKVEETACRGCGACLAACPTGAIDMGYVNDADLREHLSLAVRKSKPNGHVVVFSCIWDSAGRGLGAEPWEVRVQCTRRVSPAMLMEALAMGAKAVIVRGCDEDACHYLPGPWMGPDVVESGKAMLEALAMDPDRISYAGNDAEAAEALARVSGLGMLKPVGDSLPEIRSLGRCLNACQVLMAQPDAEPAKLVKGANLLGMGCLAVSEPAFAAYGIGDGEAMGAIIALLNASGIKFEVARDIHTSGARLGEWGMDALHKAYIGRMTKTLKAAKPAMLMVPSPRSYESLREMGLPCPVRSVPSVLCDSLAGKLPATNITIAYHPACHGGGEFDRDCIRLLGMVPGLKVIELKGECGDTGWQAPNADTAARARGLLKSAGEKGASLVVTGSPRCAANLRAVTGGWCTSSVRAIDIYGFLASVIGGEL